MALYLSFYSVVQALLDKQAVPDALDSGGKTPFYWFKFLQSVLLFHYSLCISLYFDLFRANFLHLDDIKALLPEQKYDWYKYQKSISPPEPKDEDEDDKKKKKGKGKGKKK